MPIDWTEIAKVAIPAAVAGAGAIAGKKSKSGATKQARADVEKAYQIALEAYNRAHGQATDINNWMLQSSFAPLNFGYQQGRTDFQNALLGGQQALAGGQANVADILGPYTGAGRKASGETNFLLYGAGQGSTPAPTAGNFPAPSPGSFSLPADFKGFNIAAPPSFGGGGGAGSSSGGSSNALTSFAPHLADNRTPSSMAPTIGSAVGGPIGSAIGGLIGRLTRHNREKEAASNAANEFSDWVWKEVIPTAKSEKWDSGKLKTVIDSGKNDYSNWLSGTLKDQGVIQNSQTSQFGYLDKDLAGVYSNWGVGGEGVG